MSKVSLYLSLGTNMGDRAGNITEALSRLDDALGVHWSSLSSIIETKSWGFDGEDFLNCAVLYLLPRQEDIQSQALGILDALKRIEADMGRTGDPEYAEDGRRVYHSRIIDIDILLFGREHIDHQRLKVPHPLMNQRDFVMIPLREILRDCDK